MFDEGSSRVEVNTVRNHIISVKLDVDFAKYSNCFLFILNFKRIRHVRESKNIPRVTKTINFWKYFVYLFLAS